MTVYDFLYLATDLSGVIVRVWDCKSERVVFDGKDSNHPLFDMDDELQHYEVESYDLFIDRNGDLCLELNIDLEEDEDE